MPAIIILLMFSCCRLMSQGQREQKGCFDCLSGGTLHCQDQGLVCVVDDALWASAHVGPHLRSRGGLVK